MNKSFEVGYLSIILGPMWSGKTSKIVELYKQFSFCRVETMPINYILDDRYGENCISTHDERKIPCKVAKRLSDISDICNDKLTDEFKSIQVILINEGQFFEDIKDWTLCAVEKYNKHVYICGLDGDYKREKFGDVLDLIPYCDDLVKLSSICVKCKKANAIFTHRETDESKQILIGTNEYMPLCRRCYHA